MEIPDSNLEEGVDPDEKNVQVTQICFEAKDCVIFHVKKTFLFMMNIDFMGRVWVGRHGTVGMKMLWLRSRKTKLDLLLKRCRRISGHRTVLILDR